MEQPRWFKEQVDKLWPGMLKVRWERWKANDFAIPIHGPGFYRQTHADGRVRYRILTDDPKLGTGKWFQPTGDIPKARWVVRENVKGLPKVFDCITDTGALIPLSQYVLDAIAKRHDAWVEVMNEIEEAEAVSTIEGPDGKPVTLTKRQLAARKAFEAEAKEVFMDLAEGLGNVQKVYLSGCGISSEPLEPDHRPAFTVVDKRRSFDAGDVGDGSRKT